MAVYIETFPCVISPPLFSSWCIQSGLWPQHIFFIFHIHSVPLNNSFGCTCTYEVKIHLHSLVVQNSLMHVILKTKKNLLSFQIFLFSWSHQALLYFQPLISNLTFYHPINSWWIKSSPILQSFFLNILLHSGKIILSFAYLSRQPV